MGSAGEKKFVEPPLGSSSLEMISTEQVIDETHLLGLESDIHHPRGWYRVYLTTTDAVVIIYPTGLMPLFFPEEART
jgi:hypothetical protein